MARMAAGWMVTMGLLATACYHAPPVAAPVSVPDAQIQRLRTDNGRLQDTVARQGAELADLEQALARCQATPARGDANLAVCDRRRSELRAQVHQQAAMLADARAEILRLEQRPPVHAFERAQARIAELERQLATQQPADVALRRARRRIVELEQALAQSVPPEELQRMRRRTHDLTDRLRATEAQVADLQAHLDGARARIREIETRGRGHGHPRSGGEGLRAELAASQARVVELEAALAAAPSADEFARLRHRVDELKAKLQRARERVQALESEQGRDDRGRY